MYYFGMVMAGLGAGVLIGALTFVTLMLGVVIQVLLRRAMQPLGRAEGLAAEGMRDHDVVTNFNCKHSVFLKDNE